MSDQHERARTAGAMGGLAHASRRLAIAATSIAANPATAVRTTALAIIVPEL
jgi:hypothetical protein